MMYVYLTFAKKHALFHFSYVHFVGSQKLIWLKLTPTNNDPKVICKFYLESVEECKGMYILYNFYTNMWADSRIMLQIVTEF